MSLQAHLTNAPAGGMVTVQIAKGSVGIINLLDFRRMTSRAISGSGFFRYGQAYRRAARLAVPKSGIDNSVRLATHEIINSSGQVLKTRLRSQLMAKKATIPATVKFEDTKLTVIDHDGQQWLTGPDIARALGYSDTTKIAKLYTQHSDEFTTGMSVKAKLALTGNLKVPTRIFSPRGCHLIAMFARTDKAKAFRKWVLDVLGVLEGLQAPQKPARALSLPPLPLPLASRKVPASGREAAIAHLIRRLRDHHPSIIYMIAMDREDIADELERLT